MMILTLYVWRLEREGQSRHLRAPMGHDTYRIHQKLSEATVLSSEKTHDCVPQESQKQTT